MKTASEIYSIRFNKAVLRDGDIHFTVYTLDVPIFSQASLSPLIPKSILLNNKTNKITVTFNNGNTHTLHYGEDVEIFTRPKEKPKTDEKVSFSTTD